MLIQSEVAPFQAEFLYNEIVELRGDNEVANEKYKDVYGCLDKILKSYESYFDITRKFRIFDWEVPAFARFCSRSERYVLSKRAKLWGAEAYEYLFFFCENILTLSRWEEIREFLIRSEGELVKPHGEHMYSYVSVIIICEKADIAAMKAVASFRYQKSYRFSLHGWMTARAAAVSFPDGQIICNKAGKDIRKHLKRIIEQDISCR